MSDPTEWAQQFDADLAQLMLSGGTTDSGVPGFLGVRFTTVEPGRCVAELEVGDHLLNPFGAAHGAVLASLIDHLLGSAVFPIVPRGTWPATLEFKVNYLAPVRPGTLTGTARVVSLSKRTGVVSVECESGGRLVGTALGTIALTPPKPPEG